MMPRQWTREEFDKIVSYHEQYARELGHSDANTKSCRELGVRMWLLFVSGAGNC